MPNGLQRSISAFFNRGSKDRSSGRRKKDKDGGFDFARSDDFQTFQKMASPRLSRRVQSPQETIQFVDDYVDPIDFVTRSDGLSNYDSPWDANLTSLHQNRQAQVNRELVNTRPGANEPLGGCNYDDPWGDDGCDFIPSGPLHPKKEPIQAYDDPWDRSNDRTTKSGASGTISTLSSHSSGHSARSQKRSMYRPPQINNSRRSNERANFQPDPRLVVDPSFVNNQPKINQQSVAHAHNNPSYHQRSYSNQIQSPSTAVTNNLHAPNLYTTPVHSNYPLRPARSHDSLRHEVVYDHIPSTCTPSIAESPLVFHQRQDSQPQNLAGEVGSSAYLQQLLRQTDDSISTSLDDLLYGQRNVIQPPVPMARSRSHKNPSGMRRSHGQKSPSPHRARPVMQSTMMRNLQHFAEHDIYAIEPVMKYSAPHNIGHSSSTGRSSASDKSHSSGNQTSRSQQAELLDNMDYYRSTMTRHEAEKVLDNEIQGSFLVRRNTQNPGWYSISVMTHDQGVLHLVIQKADSGHWHIGGGGVIQAEFPSVPDLISYYQEHCLNIRGTKGLKLILKYR